MSAAPEVWLRGPLNDVPALLQPVAHALLQARDEINQLMHGFPDKLLWERPVGLASPGFHLQHLTGVLDRLFTYAKQEQLSQSQLAYLQAEGKPVDNLIYTDDLVTAFNGQVNKAITQLENTTEITLTEARGVGRAMLPSTVIGLYVHAAEHTMRHTGQLLVTVKILLERS
ncbi:DinB family protein [Mucilaginibacter gotjawali]|uniref:Damage-inducible protein DinB n=2 Tax=Mucilaginibacter gotjawali TaxID=1550579 RepID=A0A839S7T8_9SPHI|nr:DinB family protein [Mucilaginibacter gotjawali]MBB3053846.1 putative damage-inducible protein DinB [Mucilaginibacter gotjawali]BAU54110.1 DinB superfamily protein [Mucilaginibacter gotjawali]